MEGIRQSSTGSISILVLQNSSALGLGKASERGVNSLFSITAIWQISPFGTKSEAANLASGSAHAFVSGRNGLFLLP